ncbi:MAG TPA: Rad52/Rad22 family DNA repair protein [Pyrinomonadaceae bacterium]
MRSIAEIINDLSKPIPPRLLKTKTVGGQKIQYIPWHTAVRFLDLYAPGWCYEIRHLTEVGNKLILVARISIPCAEGLVYREATGQEDEEVRGYGDSSSNSESMALRRAAAKFGLGLELYDKKPEKQG